MTRAMPSSVSDQCCPGCVSEVSIRALRAPLRLGNHSALLARELHYWNLKLQIGHIQHSKNLTTGDTEVHRGKEHRGRGGLRNLQLTHGCTRDDRPSAHHGPGCWLEKNRSCRFGPAGDHRAGVEYDPAS